MHVIGSFGGLSPPLPLKPRASSKLPHPGGRRRLTPRYFRELFLRVQRRRVVASACLPQGQVAKELLSLWAQRLRTGMLSAQTPSEEWSMRPALLLPSSLRSSQASVSLHRERVTLVLPPAAVPARAGSPASQPFPDQKANGSCSSPWAACCTFHRPAPGERSVRRVPFLKALSTGATALLSQAEGC